MEYLDEDLCVSTMTEAFSKAMVTISVQQSTFNRIQKKVAKSSKNGLILCYNQVSFLLENFI